MRAPPNDVDQAIARLGRIEATLRAQRDLSADERARIPPHAVFDAADAAVFAASLRLLRQDGAKAFEAGLGLGPGWRQRARSRALREALLAVPAKAAEPYARARELQRRLARYANAGWRFDRGNRPQTEKLHRAIEANGGSAPSFSTIYRTFSDPPLFERSTYANQPT